MKFLRIESLVDACLRCIAWPLDRFSTPQTFGNTELNEYTILASLTCQNCYYNLDAIKEVLTAAAVWVQSIIAVYFVISLMGIKGWATNLAYLARKKTYRKLLRIRIHTSLAILILIAGGIDTCETQIRYWSNMCVSHPI